MLAPLGRIPGTLMRARRKNIAWGGTLVVCPVSVLHQWYGEIQRHFVRRHLKAIIWHECGHREHDIDRLRSYDVVITT